MIEINRILFKSYYSFSLRKRPIVKINFDSVDKFMPEQERNIVSAARLLAKNKFKGSISISAITPKAVRLEIQKAGEKIINATSIDARELLATKKLYDAEDTFYGPIPKDERTKLDKEYFRDLLNIARNPYNFKDDIVSVYDKAIRGATC